MGSTEGGGSGIGDRVDESAVTPAPKAHEPPLQVDELHLQVQVNPDGVSVDGRAKVGGGVHRAINYALVCVTAAGTAAAAVCLCRLAHAGGWATFLISAPIGLLVLGLGVVYIWSAPVRKTGS